MAEVQSDPGSCRCGAVRRAVDGAVEALRINARCLEGRYAGALAGSRFNGRSLQRRAS